MRTFIIGSCLTAVVAAGCASTMPAKVGTETGSACQREFEDEPDEPDSNRSLPPPLLLTVSTYSAENGIRTRYGGGAVITADGSVLTAYSLIKDAEFITASVLTPDESAPGGKAVERAFPLVVERVSGERDVALLKPKYGRDAFPPLTVSKRIPTEGLTVSQMGGFFTGSIGWIRNGRANLNLMITAHRNDLGAPIVTRCGDVIGVITSTDEPRGTARAVSIGEALSALRISQ